MTNITATGIRKKKTMRLKLSEITPLRLLEAGARRVKEVRHSREWNSTTGSSGENKNKLMAYQNVHVNERCFIIANGPSLAHMDLSRLKNEVTIGMNRIYLLFDQWGFGTTYVSCINELVLEQFADDIKSLTMPKFLNWNRRSHFAGDQNAVFLKLALGFRDKFVRDLTQEISSGGTVTFACLQLAYFMGFKEVILVGLDHNFVEKGRPNKTEVRAAEVDESHCHPDYFPKGVKWQLPDLLRSEMAYSLAREAFESDGRRILDATVGGKCEIFDKVEFSSLF